MDSETKRLLKAMEKSNKKEELSYIDLLNKLYEDVDSDVGIPEAKKAEIHKNLKACFDILWDYSA